MRIIARLQIISTVTMTALAVLALVLGWAFIEFKSAKNEYILANAITANFFERTSIRDQYFLYREDRSLTLWDKNIEAADRLFVKAEEQSHIKEDKSVLDELRKNIAEGRNIFYRIVNNTDVLKTAGSNRAVYEELDKRLSSQLLLKFIVFRDTVIAWQDTSARRVEQAYRLLTILIGLFAVTLAFTTSITSMRLGRLIHKRLEPLHDGARIVAAGDLDFRIESDGSDEFAELARSINSMTDRLQKFTRQLEAEITERKLMEAELRRYKDHLEEEVQQRTADLVLARNAAEAANRAKSVFLANMSHELRTPLNAILGFSGMMRRTAQIPDSQSANLNIIIRSGEYLLNLINDVLEMAKIEAGRVQMEDAPFDLDSMVRDVTEMMQVRATEKHIRLLVEQTSAFPRYIVGDEARMRQVLINLVGNAIKFTDHGGVTVRLGTKNNAVSHLLIEVEDSGPGIEHEDQQRIFEPFVQLGEQGMNKGTGLGLTITRQFVQMMHGNLTLESTPGKGSLFRIDLPLRQARETVITPLKEEEKGDITGLAPGQPEYRILIVEDHLENQLLLAQLLESVGFQIKIAENGKRGVELFQSWHPHFIWMDRRMPVMDGVEATKTIRNLPDGKAVKIVAVTASAFQEQRAEMLEAGMDDFVRKPYRFNEIYECLSRHLGVQYVYSSSPASVVEHLVLTQEMLSVLPQELLRELEYALESLETDRIAHIIKQAAVYDPNLQKTLGRLAEDFDYPAILKALRG
jgi:signal transduction histidine kinase/DNA-binding response OmpR family regulator